jgi:pullulanase/glycogen debranching enzyme
MKINFEITKDGFTFRDALVLPDDHGMTNAQIEAMKQARFDSWFLMVTTSFENPEPEEPPED